MKKKLTQNITRYDDKIRLRFDIYTFKVVGISVVCGAAMLSALINISPVVAVSLSAMLSLTVFLLGVTKIDNMPLYSFAIYAIKTYSSKNNTHKCYEHIDTPYRISVNTEDKIFDEKKKRKEKR